MIFKPAKNKVYYNEPNSMIDIHEMNNPPTPRVSLNSRSLTLLYTYNNKVKMNLN